MNRYVLISAFFLGLSPALFATNKLTVKVDERIELITTIQLLSGYKYLTQADLDYKKEVAGTFEKYRSHEAIKLYKTISKRFYGLAPLSLILHYELPSFRQVAGWNSEDSLVLSYPAQKDTLDLFIRLVKDFYEQSSFHQFYLSHQAFYDKIASPIAAEAKKTNYISVMEKLFGKKQSGYNIILSPLQMDAGFGPMISAYKGELLYAIVGPDYESRSFPLFNSEILFKELVIHEFSHSFCNPLIDQNYAQLKKDSCLLIPILSEQQEQGYGTWLTCLYEHWTRANEIAINRMIYGDSAANALLAKNIEEDKWIYLDGLVTLIEKEYILNRKKYPSQDLVMPKLIAYFDEQSKKCR